MSTSLASKKISLKALKERARMLACVRAFFADRNLLEVDTPILSRTAPISTHIDVMTLHFTSGEKGYLHTSPEYAMKRLLAEHATDIYQLSHVFREGEVSERHNPEFTMIEWYRIGFSLNDLIHETLELIHLFLGSQKATFFTYQDFFLHHLAIDPFQTSSFTLLKKALELKLSIPEESSSWDIDTWLYFFMGVYLEPQMKGLTVIQSFPVSQAALSRLRKEGLNLIADRFEIFYNGIELANGFHELTDPIEQKNRFEQDNLERQKMGKEPLPLDKHFLAALEKGLPDCSGVAVGFDRLLMLQQKATSLQEIFPLTWDQI